MTLSIKDVEVSKDEQDICPNVTSDWNILPV